MAVNVVSVLPQATSDVPRRTRSGAQEIEGQSGWTIAIRCARYMDPGSRPGRLFGV